MAICSRGNSFLHLQEEYRQPLADAGLDSLEALLSTAGHTSLDKPGLASWRTRLRLELPTEAVEPTCFLKRYLKVPWPEQLKQRLAGYRDTAATEWRWLKAFAERGLPGPRPVAYGVRRCGWLEHASVLVTAKVPGESLERWAPREADGRLRSRRLKNQLLQGSAHVIAKLHGAGLIHRDLYLAHLFIDLPTEPPEVAPGASPEVAPGAAAGEVAGEVAAAAELPLQLTLIDLQRVIQPRFRWQRWVVKDLSALHYSTPPEVASRADRLRWLKTYLGPQASRQASSRRRMRVLIAKIERKTARVRRHDARRLARLSPS